MASDGFGYRHSPVRDGFQANGSS